MPFQNSLKLTHYPIVGQSGLVGSHCRLARGPWRRGPFGCALLIIISLKSADPTGRGRLGPAIPGFRPLPTPRTKTCPWGPRLRGLHPGLLSTLPPGAKNGDTPLDIHRVRCASCPLQLRAGLKPCLFKIVSNWPATEYPFHPSRGEDVGRGPIGNSLPSGISGACPCRGSRRADPPVILVWPFSCEIGRRFALRLH